jgi:UDP:flavonoid glycosyltransferase YjiC (YdhE family)
VRIVLASVGTAGDVRPFATLASRLLERGHEVTAVTWPVHRTAFARPGIQVELAGPHADPARIAAVAADAAGRTPFEQVAVLRDFHLAPIAEFVADGSAPIVVTFGSMSGPGEAELTAVLKLILTGGRRVILQGSSPISSPNLLTIGPIDHGALFPRAAAVVHHGGAGTSHAVAAAGVPSVVAPQVGDQRHWADRLHRLGVAAPPMPIGRLRPADLADVALATASDPGLLERARLQAKLVAAEDGIGTAIKRLEAIATQGLTRPGDNP